MVISLDNSDPSETGLTTGFHYTVFVRDALLIRSGTSLKIVPNAQARLYRRGTTVPAVIYSDDNYTQVRSDGVVITDENGMWEAFLDPTYAPYDLFYKEQQFKSVPVPADARESEHDLGNLVTTYGLDKIGQGETIATRQWAQENLASGGLNTEQVKKIVNDALTASAGGSTSGLTASQVQALINNSLSSFNPVVPTPDLTPYARFRGDTNLRDFIVSNTFPTGSYEAVPQIGPNGKIYFQERTLSTGPTTPPASSESLDVSLWLSTSNNHYKARYLGSDGKLTGTTISVRAIARTLEQTVIVGDKDAFDKVFKWAQANLKRTSQATAKDLYGSTYTASSNSVTSWTVDSGAMLSVFGALFRAWNLWGESDYKDAASKIISDLVNYCVIYDEGRAYLTVDETQKAVQANGVYGHHVDPATGGAVSMHEIGQVNVIHFRAAKTFTGAAVFDQLINGWYDIVNKMLAQNTSAPFADIISYNPVGHSVGPVAAGTAGWTIDRSYVFGLSAQRVGTYLLTDKRLFNNANAVNALTKLRTFYTTTWNANQKIVNAYGRDGSVNVATESLESALLAALILEDGASNNAVAAAIRAAKVPTSLTTDLQATAPDNVFIWNSVKGTTASSDPSSRDQDLLAWAIFARNRDVYVEIAKLGTNPNVGVLYPPSGNNNDGGSNVPVIVVPDPTTPVQPPITSTEKLYADSQGEAWNYYNANQGSMSATVKARWQYFLSRPSGKWDAARWDPNGSDLKAYIDRAEAAGAWACVLIYDMVGRDKSGGYSEGGQATAEAYRNFIINNVVPAIGNRKVIMDYEPDSLPDFGALNAGELQVRTDVMKWAVAYMMQKCPNLRLYIDVGHSNWNSAEETARRMRMIGYENATGFAINTSNAYPTTELVNWANQIRGILGGNVPFVIDVGRNGSGKRPTRWANPAMCQFGAFPRMGNTGISGCDAFVDWKRPGESDGNSGDGSPNAGEFWPLYIYNPTKGDNVDNDAVSQSSGMLQRPPVPGVANPYASGGQNSN